jgi:hypothetical protein
VCPGSWCARLVVCPARGVPGSWCARLVVCPAPPPGGRRRGPAARIDWCEWRQRCRSYDSDEPATPMPGKRHRLFGGLYVAYAGVWWADQWVLGHLYRFGQTLPGISARPIPAPAAWFGEAGVARVRVRGRFREPEERPGRAASDRRTRGEARPGPRGQQLAGNRVKGPSLFEQQQRGSLHCAGTMPGVLELCRAQAGTAARPAFAALPVARCSRKAMTPSITA